MANKGSTLKTKFGLGKRNAKSRHHKWTLTFKQYALIIQNKTCYYCSGKLSLNGVNLDRINPNKGYSIKNVVPCCKGCNITRNKYISSNEMLQIVKLLKTLRNTENIWEYCDYGKGQLKRRNNGKD